MDRTKEYRSHQPEKLPKEDERLKAPAETTTKTFLNIARDLRTSLEMCYTSLEKRQNQIAPEVEKSVKSLSKESNRIIDLLNSLEEPTEFIESVVVNIRAAVKKTEIKLEEKKNKRIIKSASLSIALEPERAKSSPRTKEPTKGIMMQVLQEENVRILERVRSTEREVFQVRRRLSEIETLQRLITQELFIQDERIDVVLSNTSAASVDVKISRTYIRNAGEKKKVAKRFISLFIMILAIVLLILHYSNK